MLLSMTDTGTQPGPRLLVFAMPRKALMADRRVVLRAARQARDKLLLDPLAFGHQGEAMTTCGEAIPKLLKAYGCEVVFGIPGTHSIELYRGLGDGTLRHILPRHEQGAAFMAEGYARASGKPALCCLITGPGLTNAATGIAEAFSSSVPMLVITPVNARESLGKGWGRLHELTDQSAVAKPFTAFSRTVMSPKEVPELIAEAYSGFASARPRPVHIEIPIDVMTEAAEGDWTPRPPAQPPVVTSDDVAKATNLLATARRPAILAGGGALRAGDEIRSLAEKLGAPVVTSFAGKGILPRGHDLSVGSTISLSGTKKLLGNADVIVAVGTELSEVDAWDSWIDIPGKIIRIDIDPHELDSDYPSAVALLGDAAATLREIIAALPNKLDPQHEGLERADAARKKNNALVDPLQRRHLDVLDVLRRELPPETIFVGDMTQVVYTADRHLEVDHPGHYMGAHGYGTLGYALPTAIGAKIGAPDKPVVALAGDSGVLYTIQEMATAVEQKVPVILYIWNNRALGQIRDDMVSAQIEPFAVLPDPPDFQMIAEGFGWRTDLSSGPDHLAELTKAALAHDGPSLIEVRDPEVWR